jgi:branched-chain amino acid transport system permease protein
VTVAPRGRAPRGPPAPMSPLARTAEAVREAGLEARAGWGRVAWLALAAVAVAAAVPLVLPASIGVDGLAQTGYLALAAVGLGFASGIGGMPSVTQGAFLGLGALVAAHVLRAGGPPAAAAVAGTAAAALAGAVVGGGLARLRPVYVAAATWLLAWLFALALGAFASLSGGAQGLVVPPTGTATLHYELALGLTVLAVLAHRALTRSTFGLRLRAASVRPAAADALGVPRGRLRTGAFAGAAAAGGLAGSLAVQLAAVADPSTYGPSLSFRLLIAVLVGGAASSLGPVAGVLALGVLSLAAEGLGNVTGADTARFGPMFAALLLLAVLASGGDGLVPEMLRRLRRRPPAPPVPPAVRPPEPAELVVERLDKRFDALAALRGLGLDVGSGRVAALIGPNGSGKTTALRVLSGTLPADRGSVRLDGHELLGESAAERIRLGVVRTLQSSGVFPGLTALENALVGAALRRRYGGAVRALFATPKARAEARRVEALAAGALATVGLERAAHRPADELTGAEQRLLMLATALATEPRVLLADEPSAGAGSAELDRLARVVEDLRGRGLAVLLVEHNLRLVRLVADEVVVLAAGAPLASGTPDEVARDERVRAAYLGRHRL